MSLYTIVRVCTYIIYILPHKMKYWHGVNWANGDLISEFPILKPTKVNCFTVHDYTLIMH